MSHIQNLIDFIKRSPILWPFDITCIYAGQFSALCEIGNHMPTLFILFLGLIEEGACNKHLTFEHFTNQNFLTNQLLANGRLYLQNQKILLQKL